MMELALRVLSAINQMRNPDEADVQALQAFTGHIPEGVNLAEFVCDTIQNALKQRKPLRRVESERTRSAREQPVYSRAV